MEIWEFVGWILAVYITLCVAGLLLNLLVPLLGLLGLAAVGIWMGVKGIYRKMPWYTRRSSTGANG